MVKLEHPKKADWPISYTLSGISIVVKLKHPKKAESPISYTLSGISIVVKLKHSKKAESPISYTLSEISIVVKLIQVANAYSSIFFPPVMITSFKLLGTNNQLSSHVLAPNIYPKKLFCKLFNCSPTKGIVILSILLHS